MEPDFELVEQSKALAGEPRILILHWLKAPNVHFSHQVSGDPEVIGVCVTLITEKLGMSQPTVSRHLEVLKRAGFLSGKKIGKWTFYSRNEAVIAGYTARLAKEI